MKVGDKIEAVGVYRTFANEDVLGEVKTYFPDFLVPGIHTIQAIQTNEWGTLVKTNKMDFWVNIRWFKPVK